MARDSSMRSIPRTTTRLSSGTVFKGKMKFTDSVSIGGRFEGEIRSSGFLYIEEGAEVHADVFAETVIIAGVVRGSVLATARLEMLSTGRIYGDVKASKLRIADGVVFEGKCRMLRNADAVDIFAAPVEQLKEGTPRVVSP